MVKFFRSKYREINKSPLLIFLFFALRSFYSICDDNIKRLFGKKPTLYYVELSVADHCNLNCKGCTFFSNIIGEKSFADLNQYKADMKRLGELFGNIRNISLLGGEPLLNEELPYFIYEARKAFPKSKIRVVSNGLLCKSMSDELIAALKDNDAWLHISLYKPLFDGIDSLKQFLESRGIKYIVGSPATKFFKGFRFEGDSDVNKAFSLCTRKRCIYLSSGHISVCSVPVLLKWFDRHFGKSLSESVKNDIISIYDDKIDGFILKKKLSKPISACKYCSGIEWFDWELSTSDAKIEDYTVSGVLQ